MNKTMSNHARTLTYQPSQRMALLRSLSVPLRSVVFQELSPYVQQSILSHLKDYELVDMLDHMDMDQAERVMAQLGDVKRRQRVIKRLKGDIREKMDYFLRFHPQASLSLINFNYLFLPSSLSIGEAAAVIDEHYEEMGKYPELLVHENGRLVGEVPFAAMVRERNSSQLKKHLHEIPTISYQSDIPKIIDLLTGTQSKKIVVLDHDESVLGIIYADATRPLFASLPAESLYDFAGLDNSEKPFDSVHKKVTSRYRWLILNLLTCFLAGSVILSFQDTLNALTILTIYIPLIAGMGGNAATQAFAISVRGITLGTINLQNAAPAIWREMLAGSINGIIIGSIVALISYLWDGELYLGLVVGLALVAAHTVAAVAGAFVPLLMKHFGKDPAATSSIFISTVTDVFGLIFLLGFAQFFLL
jgi:magnesium transporter